MRKFFDAYKNYIVNHPNMGALSPTSDEFNTDALFDVCENVCDVPECTEDDVEAITVFVRVSSDLHHLYKDLYRRLDDIFASLNLRGCDIAEYFVAGLNKELQVIRRKHREAVEKVDKGSYYFADILDFKVQSSVPGVGLLDARGALESFTDGLSRILNYLKYFLGKDFSSADAAPEAFAGNVLSAMQLSQMVDVLKYSYDDVLYNGGFITADAESRLVTFDYENRSNLILLKAGDIMFNEHKLQVMQINEKMGEMPRLAKFTANCRIKCVKISESRLTIELEQGCPRMFIEMISEMQAVLDSYFEYLPGGTVLPDFAGCTVDEAVAVWCAIQYIAEYVVSNVDYDTGLYGKGDFSSVPTKMLKADLISGIVHLTEIKQAKVMAVVGAMEAKMKGYNDIWSRMLIPQRDHYLLPFFPMINSSPFNMVDHLLQTGGFDLKERGKMFERYIYSQLTGQPNAYPLVCLRPGYYGIDGDKEEIDILVSMKNVVLVGDAKCIRYSMEPQNYADAWSRLVEGCEQVIRKMEFVRRNPQYFSGIGDYSSKRLIPMVVTNYPKFTGFSHKGVYVIDSHSFLAYMQRGVLNVRQLSASVNKVVDSKRFYNNEDEYSDRFMDYLSDNPVKALLSKRISIRDLPLTVEEPGSDSWRIVCKLAQLDNDVRFNINAS